MLDAVSIDHRIAINDLNTLLLAGLEFRSVHANVELRIDGPDPEELHLGIGSSSEIDIEIEILLGNQREASKTFSFTSEAGKDTKILWGLALQERFITVPCDVSLGGGYEIEMTAPVELIARSVALEAKSLIIRPTKGNADEVIITCARLNSSLENIVTNGATFILA